MTAKSIRSLALAAAVVASACLAAFAQSGTSSAQPVSLSGSYELAKVHIGQTAVSMEFSATVTNSGANDLSGPIVLRHPNDIQKVYYRFGDQSIGVGKTVTVRANISVPREIYNGWGTAGPALFFYTKNDRGDIKTYRVSLTAAKPPPAPSK